MNVTILSPGYTLRSDRFVILSRLDQPKPDGRGKGGQGAVYLAKDKQLRRQVAIKQMLTDDLELIWQL